MLRTLDLAHELAPNPTKAEIAAQGKTGFVVVATRWVIERSNAWMERCAIAVLTQVEYAKTQCSQAFPI